MSEILYCHTKKEQQALVSEMTQKGYWLASVKGRTVKGVNVRMLTFYANALKSDEAKTAPPKSH